MKVYDISLPIERSMPVYKARDEKRPRIYTQRDFAGGSIYESGLDINLHTGTHMDAALHVLPGGAAIDKTPLSSVVRPCRVVDLQHVCDAVTDRHLAAQQVAAGEFILLKTGNPGKGLLEGEFVYLAESGAAYLAAQQAVGVGIDALGIERNQPGHPTHHLILGNNMALLEGLYLENVAAGRYLLVAPPLKIIGAEAAPVRALLFETVIETLEYGKYE